MTDEVSISAFDQDLVETTGTWGFAVSTTRRMNGEFVNNGTDLDACKFNRYFPKSGTYKVRLVHDTNSDMGILDMGMDTAASTDLFSQIDMYAASRVGFVIEETTISVARGQHEIHLTTNGKNGSASDHDIRISLIQFDLIDEHQVLGEDAPMEDKPFWEEIGHFDITTANANVRVPIKPKRYIKVLFYMIPTASLVSYLRFNNDSAGTDTTSGNYSQRTNNNGGTDDVTGEQDRTLIELFAGTGVPFFTTIDIVNIFDQEKLVFNHVVSTGGAGEASAPNREENVSKWDNGGVDVLINEITLDTSTSTYAAGSFVRVLGHD